MRVGTSFRDIISRLPQNSDNLAPTAIFATFRNLQNVEHMTQEDLQHYKFQSFLNRTKTLIPQMTAQELSDIAINILYPKPLRQNEIYCIIQDALMLKIEELPSEQMLCLGVIIRKTQSSSSFESIHSKIREIFLENAEHIISADHSYNIRSFFTIVNYMTRNVEIVRTDILEAFSNAVLLTDRRQLHIPNVETIIFLFSKFDELNGRSKNALNFMVNFWIEHNPRVTDIERLLSHLSRNGKLDKRAFEESGLIRFISTVLDEDESADRQTIRCFEHLTKMVMNTFFWNATRPLDNGKPTE